jgi:hypothetical protein
METSEKFLTTSGQLHLPAEIRSWGRIGYLQPKNRAHENRGHLASGFLKTTSREGMWVLERKIGARIANSTWIRPGSREDKGLVSNVGIPSPAFTRASTALEKAGTI